MVRELPNRKQGGFKETDNKEQFSLGDLDLLNLRLNFSSDEADTTKGTTYRNSDRGSGDSCCLPTRSRHRHPFEKFASRPPLPNISRAPHGYTRNCRATTTISSENLLLLCPKDTNPEFYNTKPIDSKDFLYPSRKKTHTKVIDVVSDCAFSKYDSRTNKLDNADSFPFQLTPSGNLKVDSTQVVFSSNKLSVLVADPRNTTVNIHPETNYSKMKHEDIPKTSAMETIMSQAGFSSLNTFIGSPNRSSHKEASEYESKQTSEILDPELNLGRLGYNISGDICWQNIVLPEKKNLYLELYSRITNYTNADCKVYIENEEFNCHLIVLQCYSDLFDAYVAVKKIELPPDKCSAASFAFIYEWMITGEPSYKDLSRENILDIFTSAKYLQIKDLVEQCWAFIDNSEVFSEDTAFLLYMDAKERDLPEVKELMLPRLQGFFLMLVSSQNWLELELEDVVVILSSNYIRVSCEMEVFMSAVRWLKHDYPQRDPHKYEVMQCVRFGNIAPWQLVDIKRNPENPDYIELAKDAKICKMIDDGLAFVIIKYWYGNENEDFKHWNELLGLNEPQPRNWSGSDKIYFTFREFLIYLDQYRRNQLIERKKPLLNSDLAFDKKNTANREPEKPTADFFLTKKKESSTSFNVTTVTKTTDKSPIAQPKDSFQLYRNLKKQRLKKTKDEAAAIIQRAYRRYRRRKNLLTFNKRVVTKRRDHISPHKKMRTDSFFMEVMNKLTHSKNKSPVMKQILTSTVHHPERRQLLVRNSLFQELRETILVFGGVDPHADYGVGRNTGMDIFQYISEDNSWAFVGEMPAPRHHHGTDFFKGRIYIVGGADPRQNEEEGNSCVVGTVWSFDPVHRTWYHEVSLTVPRKNFGLVSYNNGLYAIGGQGIKYEALKSVEKYNIEKNCWEKMASLHKERTGLACTKYKNCIWIAGGLCGNNKKISVLDSVECYDIKKNQWTKISQPLRFARCFSRMFVLSDVLYLIGGAGKTAADNRGTISLGAIDVWNDNRSEWKYLTELNMPRHGHSVAYLGTQMLVIGGVTTIYSRALSNVECFCSQRGVWIRGLACLPTALTGHSTVTLPPASLLTY